MNDANPYAAPEYVEEDAPSYDLRKIARLYNRLGVLLKWFTLLFVIWVPGFACIAVFVSAQFYYDLNPSVIDTIRFVLMCLVFPAHLGIIILGNYSIVITVLNTFTLKYRGATRPLIILGAIYFPFTIFVMNLMRRKAAQILRDSGVEITKGKVDLAQIPVEEDY